MNFKTKLSLVAILVATVFTSNAAILSTNYVGTNAVALLSTNRASVYSIGLVATNAGTISIYDCDNIAVPLYGTNYTNGAWISRTSYATNLVTSYVGTTGFTNWYTNVGLFTATITNAAATNALSPLVVLPFGANQAVTYQIDALFARGVTILPSANVGIDIYYNRAQ